MNRREALTVLGAAPLVARAEIDFSSLTPVEVELLRACCHEHTGVVLDDGSNLERITFSLRDRGYLKICGTCSRGINWHGRTELGDRALEWTDKPSKNVD